MTYRVGGFAGAVAVLVGVAGAIPLIWREIAEAQGKCDYVSCVNTSTAPTLVGLGLLTLVGICVMGLSVRRLVHQRRIALQGRYRGRLR